MKTNLTSKKIQSRADSLKVRLLEAEQVSTISDNAAKKINNQQKKKMIKAKPRLIGVKDIGNGHGAITIDGQQYVMPRVIFELPAAKRVADEMKTFPRHQYKKMIPASKKLFKNGILAFERIDGKCVVSLKK